MPMMRTRPGDQSQTVEKPEELLPFYTPSSLGDAEKFSLTQFIPEAGLYLPNSKLFSTIFSSEKEVQIYNGLYSTPEAQTALAGGFKNALLLFSAAVATLRKFALAAHQDALALGQDMQQMEQKIDALIEVSKRETATVGEGLRAFKAATRAGQLAKDIHAKSQELKRRKAVSSHIRMQLEKIKAGKLNPAQFVYPGSLKYCEDHASGDYHAKDFALTEDAKIQANEEYAFLLPSRLREIAEKGLSNVQQSIEVKKHNIRQTILPTNSSIRPSLVAEGFCAFVSSPAVFVSTAASAVIGGVAGLFGYDGWSIFNKTRLKPNSLLNALFKEQVIQVKGDECIVREQSIKTDLLAAKVAQSLFGIANYNLISENFNEDDLKFTLKYIEKHGNFKVYNFDRGASPQIAIERAQSLANFIAKERADTAKKMPSRLRLFFPSGRPSFSIGRTASRIPYPRVRYTRKHTTKREALAKYDAYLAMQQEKLAPRLQGNALTAFFDSKNAAQVARFVSHLRDFWKTNKKANEDKVEKDSKENPDHFYVSVLLASTEEFARSDELSPGQQQALVSFLLRHKDDGLLADIIRYSLTQAKAETPRSFGFLNSADRQNRVDVGRAYQKTLSAIDIARLPKPGENLAEPVQFVCFEESMKPGSDEMNDPASKFVARLQQDDSACKDYVKSASAPTPFQDAMYQLMECEHGIKFLDIYNHYIKKVAENGDNFGDTVLASEASQAASHLQLGLKMADRFFGKKLEGDAKKTQRARHKGFINWLLDLLQDDPKNPKNENVRRVVGDDIEIRCGDRDSDFAKFNKKSSAGQPSVRNQLVTMLNRVKASYDSVAGKTLREVLDGRLDSIRGTYGSMANMLISGAPSAETMKYINIAQITLEATWENDLQSALKLKSLPNELKLSTLQRKISLDTVSGSTEIADYLIKVEDWPKKLSTDKLKAITNSEGKVIGYNPYLTNVGSRATPDYKLTIPGRIKALSLVYSLIDDNRRTAAKPLSEAEHALIKKLDLGLRVAFEKGKEGNLLKHIMLHYVRQNLNELLKSPPKFDLGQAERAEQLVGLITKHGYESFARRYTYSVNNAYKQLSLSLNGSPPHNDLAKVTEAVNREAQLEQLLRFMPTFEGKDLLGLKEEPQDSSTAAASSGSQEVLLSRLFYHMRYLSLAQKGKGYDIDVGDLRSDLVNEFLDGKLKARLTLLKEKDYFALDPKQEDLLNKEHFDQGLLPLSTNNSRDALDQLLRRLKKLKENQYFEPTSADTVILAILNCERGVDQIAIDSIETLRNEGYLEFVEATQLRQIGANKKATTPEEGRLLAKLYMSVVLSAKVKADHAVPEHKRLRDALTKSTVNEQIEEVLSRSKATSRPYIGKENTHGLLVRMLATPAQTTTYFKRRLAYLLRNVGRGHGEKIKDGHISFKPTPIDIDYFNSILLGKDVLGDVPGALAAFNEVLREHISCVHIREKGKGDLRWDNGLSDFIEGLKEDQSSPALIKKYEGFREVKQAYRAKRIRELLRHAAECRFEANRKQVIKFPIPWTYDLTHKHSRTIKQHLTWLDENPISFNSASKAIGVFTEAGLVSVQTAIDEHFREDYISGVYADAEKWTIEASEVVRRFGSPAQWKALCAEKVHYLTQFPYTHSNPPQGFDVCLEHINAFINYIETYGKKPGLFTAGANKKIFTNFLGEENFQSIFIPHDDGAVEIKPFNEYNFTSYSFNTNPDRLDGITKLVEYFASDEELDLFRLSMVYQLILGCLHGGTQAATYEQQLKTFMKQLASSSRIAKVDRITENVQAYDITCTPASRENLRQLISLVIKDDQQQWNKSIEHFIRQFGSSKELDDYRMKWVKECIKKNNPYDTEGQILEREKEEDETSQPGGAIMPYRAALMTVRASRYARDDKALNELFKFQMDHPWRPTTEMLMSKYGSRQQLGLYRIKRLKEIVLAKPDSEPLHSGRMLDDLRLRRLNSVKSTGVASNGAYGIDDPKVCIYPPQEESERFDRFEFSPRFIGKLDRHQVTSEYYGENPESLKALRDLFTEFVATYIPFKTPDDAATVALNQVRLKEQPRYAFAQYMIKEGVQFNGAPIENGDIRLALANKLCGAGFLLDETANLEHRYAHKHLHNYLEALEDTRAINTKVVEFKATLEVDYEKAQSQYVSTHNDLDIALGTSTLQSSRDKQKYSGMLAGYANETLAAARNAAFYGGHSEEFKAISDNAIAYLNGKNGDPEVLRKIFSSLTIYKPYFSGEYLHVFRAISSENQNYQAWNAVESVTETKRRLVGGCDELTEVLYAENPGSPDADLRAKALTLQPDINELETKIKELRMNALKPLLGGEESNPGASRQRTQALEQARKRLRKLSKELDTKQTELRGIQKMIGAQIAVRLYLKALSSAKGNEHADSLKEVKEAAQKLISIYKRQLFENTLVLLSERINTWLLAGDIRFGALIQALRPTQQSPMPSTFIRLSQMLTQLTVGFPLENTVTNFIFAGLDEKGSQGKLGEVEKILGGKLEKVLATDSEDEIKQADALKGLLNSLLKIKLPETGAKIAFINEMTDAQGQKETVVDIASAETVAEVKAQVKIMADKAMHARFRKSTAGLAKGAAIVKRLDMQIDQAKTVDEVHVVYKLIHEVLADRFWSNPDKLFARSLSEAVRAAINILPKNQRNDMAQMAKVAKIERCSECIPAVIFAVPMLANANQKVSAALTKTIKNYIDLAVADARSPLNDDQSTQFIAFADSIISVCQGLAPRMLDKAAETAQAEVRQAIDSKGVRDALDKFMTKFYQFGLSARLHTVLVRNTESLSARKKVMQSKALADKFILVDRKKFASVDETTKQAQRLIAKVSQDTRCKCREIYKGLKKELTKIKNGSTNILEISAFNDVLTLAYGLPSRPRQELLALVADTQTEIAKTSPVDARLNEVLKALALSIKETAVQRDRQAIFNSNANYNKTYTVARRKVSAVLSALGPTCIGNPGSNQQKVGLDELQETLGFIREQASAREIKRLCNITKITNSEDGLDTFGYVRKAIRGVLTAANTSSLISAQSTLTEAWNSHQAFISINNKLVALAGDKDVNRRFADAKYAITEPEWKALFAVKLRRDRSKLYEEIPEASDMFKTLRKTSADLYQQLELEINPDATLEWRLNQNSKVIMGLISLCSQLSAPLVNEQGQEAKIDPNTKRVDLFEDMLREAKSSRSIPTHDRISNFENFVMGYFSGRGRANKYGIQAPAELVTFTHLVYNHRGWDAIGEGDESALYGLVASRCVITSGGVGRLLKLAYGMPLDDTERKVNKVATKHDHERHHFSMAVNMLLELYKGVGEHSDAFFTGEHVETFTKTWKAKIEKAEEGIRWGNRKTSFASRMLDCLENLINPTPALTTKLLVDVGYTTFTPSTQGESRSSRDSGYYNTTTPGN